MDISVVVPLFNEEAVSYTHLQRNSDNEGIRYKLGNAKIMVEIELQQDEIIKLNLKKKIAELLDGGANK